MLMPAAAWRTLLDAGVDVTATSADTADLVVRDREGHVVHRVEAKIWHSPRPVPPSAVRRAATGSTGDRVLLIVPHATPAARAAAAEAGWSLIALNAMRPHGPDGSIRLPNGDVVSLGREQEQVTASSPRRGRRPWGAAAVARQLLEQPVARQGNLATRARITQARASQVLRELGERGLVTRRGAAGAVVFAVEDWDALLEHWLSTYPGPGGLSSYWYGLQELEEQATEAGVVLRASSARRVAVDGQAFDDRPVVLSGDLAADVLAPWRRPQRVVLYAPTGADLGEAGLQAAEPDEATLELVVPRDHTVWRVEDLGDPPVHPASRLPLADPLQVLWDVRRAPGPDADQAATRLTDALRQQFWVCRSGAGA